MDFRILSHPPSRLFEDREIYLLVTEIYIFLHGWNIVDGIFMIIFMKEILSWFIRKKKKRKERISRQLENEKQPDIIYLPIATTPAKNPALAYKLNARKSIQTYVNARMQNARFN